MAKSWQNSGFVAHFFHEICTFWRTINGILAEKSCGKTMSIAHLIDQRKMIFDKK